MLDLELETEKHLNKDIIFDRAAETAGSLIAGGYYLAKPTVWARNFFKKLSSDLQWKYVPDNTLMTSLCADQELVNCGQIPFRFGFKLIFRS